MKSPKEMAEELETRLAIQDADNVLEKFAKEVFGHGYDAGYEDGFNADKWISVAEKMPQEEQRCLIPYGEWNGKANETQTEAHMAIYTGGRFEVCDRGGWDGIDINEAGKWMPLPPPPKAYP